MLHISLANSDVQNIPTRLIWSLTEQANKSIGFDNTEHIV